MIVYFENESSKEFAFYFAVSGIVAVVEPMSSEPI